MSCRLYIDQLENEESKELFVLFIPINTEFWITYFSDMIIIFLRLFMPNFNSVLMFALVHYVCHCS
jgi:hypothetical protein